MKNTPIWLVDNLSLTSLTKYHWDVSCVRHWRVNTLRPRQDGRHFPNDIFKCIFLNENVHISIRISLKFVPRGPVNKIPALVHYLNQSWLVYWRIYASLGLNELNSFVCFAIGRFQAPVTLQWCHNERDSVSNHRRLDCLSNHLFRHRSKKTSELRAIGFVRGTTPPVTRNMFLFDDVIMSLPGAILAKGNSNKSFTIFYV